MQMFKKAGKYFNLENNIPGYFFFGLIFALCLAIALLVYFFGIIAIFIAACALVLLVSLSNNKRLLLFLLFFIPVLPKINLLSIPGSTIAVRVEDILFTIVIFSVIFTALIKKESLRMDKFKRTVFWFIAISFLSLLLGILQGSIEVQTAPFMFFLRRVEYISFFFLAYLIADAESIDLIKRTIVPTFLVVAIIAVLQAVNMFGCFFHGEYIPEGIGRVLSTFSTPGELAAYLAIIFTFSVFGILDKKPFRKFFWLVIAGSQVFILFLATTRIEFISIPLGLAFLGIMKGKIRQLIIVFVLLAVISFVFAPSTLRERFSLIFSRETGETISDVATGRGSVDINNALESEKFVPPEYDLSALMRIYYWMNAIDVFKTYPILGAGPSALGDVVDNNYLRVLGENGIAGFAVFVILIYQIWKNCVRVYNNEMMSKETRDYALFVLVMLVNMLVIALMADVFEMSKIAFLFWLLVGVFFKVKDLSEKEYSA